MLQKNLVRKKYYLLRKKKYYEVSNEFFNPILNLIKKKFKKKKIKIALYYPSSFEINILKILDFNYIANQSLLLPVIKDDNSMKFFSWKKNDVLQVNKYGMLEPIKLKQNILKIQF